MARRSTQNLVFQIARWAARIWSAMMAIVAILMAVAPDPYLVRPVPMSDWIELGFYWLAILGLLVAWRWELAGAGIALAGIVGHTLAFRVANGTWFVQTLPIIALGAPAVVLLACWAISHRHRAARTRE